MTAPENITHEQWLIQARLCSYLSSPEWLAEKCQAMYDMLVLTRDKLINDNSELLDSISISQEINKFLEDLTLDFIKYTPLTKTSQGLEKQND